MVDVSNRQFHLNSDFTIIDRDENGFFRRNVHDWNSDRIVDAYGVIVEEDDPRVKKLLDDLHLTSFQGIPFCKLEKYISLMKSKKEIFSGCVTKENYSSIAMIEDDNISVKTPFQCYGWFDTLADAAAQVGVSLELDSSFIKEMLVYLGENSYMIYLNHYSEDAAMKADFDELDKYVELAKNEAAKFDKQIESWMVDSLYIRAHRGAEKATLHSVDLIMKMIEHVIRNRNKGNRIHPESFLGSYSFPSNEIYKDCVAILNDLNKREYHKKIRRSKKLNVMIPQMD